MPVIDIIMAHANKSWSLAPAQTRKSCELTIDGERLRSYSGSSGISAERR